MDFTFNELIVQDNMDYILDQYALCVMGQSSIQNEWTAGTVDYVDSVHRFTFSLPEEVQSVLLTHHTLCNSSSSFAHYVYNRTHQFTFKPRDPNEPDKLSEAFQEDPQRVGLIINKYAEMVYGKPPTNGSQKSQS